MRYPAVITENVRLLRHLAAGGVFNTAGLGFAAYVAVICYPGIKATPAMLMDLRSGQISMADAGESSLVIAVPALLLGLLLFARHGMFTAIYRALPFLVFLLGFSGLVILMSVLGSEYLSSLSQILQYAVTVSCFMLCLCFWQARARDVDNALAMAFVALAGALSIAAIWQGFHDYRWVGLIHPNHFARYAYVALLLHSLVVRRVSLPVFLLSFAASYMVSARTIMIGTLLFYAGYLALTPHQWLTSRARQRLGVQVLGVALVALPLALAIAACFIDTDRLIDKITNDLAIFDRDRGVLSGFTGRSESWNAFLDVMDQFVVFGYGFRSSRYNLHAVHSGILSYFMDFGLILGSLLLVVIISRAIYLVVSGARGGDRRTLIAGLALVTTLIIQGFEPDNFNIGFIGAFFFMLILAYVPQRSLPAIARARQLHHPVRSFSKLRPAAPLQGMPS